MVNVIDMVFVLESFSFHLLVNILCSVTNCEEYYSIAYL